MTGDKDQRVIGWLCRTVQDPLGDHGRRCREIDTVQIALRAMPSLAMTSR